jgi:hypothetical protein
MFKKNKNFLNYKFKNKIKAKNKSMNLEEKIYIHHIHHWLQ